MSASLLRSGKCPPIRLPSGRPAAGRSRPATRPGRTGNRPIGTSPGRRRGDRSRDWGPRREDPPPGREKQGLLSGLLGKLKLDGIDSGDLLLLAILFLLFQEGEDEELLIALGLLLIL